MTIQWPEALKPRSMSHELRSFVLSGGRSIAGTEQRVFAGVGRWEITYEVPVHTRAQALAWRALLARLRAGEDVSAKVFDMWRAVGSSDSATVTAAASKGATVIAVDPAGATVEPGLHFSISGRLYRILDIQVDEGGDWEDGEGWSDAEAWPDEDFGDGISLRILPPLRAAVAASQPVSFSDLRCLCVIGDMQGGDLDLDLGRFATPTITLVEAL
ncbi:hypothetical protein ACO2RV_17165 [Ancylobacter sp. VNQ12]|uniref:hypothetical protein n=1 Tax=Ancylobacter sp. VNQ12 TaxID=3400920 RepID=UPI003C09342C